MSTDILPEPAMPPGPAAAEVYWARPLMIAAMLAIAAQLGRRVPEALAVVEQTEEAHTHG
jgi:hypothetical protein